MNKFKTTSVIALCAVACMLSCQKESGSGVEEDEKVAVTGISLNPSSLTLTEGETSTLSATIAPLTATNKSVTWSSDNTSVATVDKGFVTAKSAGSAIITVKTEDGGKTATCSVTVNAKTIAVTGVSLDKASVELTEGESCTLTATVSPADASNRNVTWSSSDETVAAVANGEVTALKGGTATITVTTEDGGKTTACQVSVKVPVTGVDLDKTSVELTEGESTTLIATVLPKDASNKTVTWSSSDENIVTVKDGEIWAIKTGSATITVKTEDGGKTADCSVIVKNRIESSGGEDVGFENW